MLFARLKIFFACRKETVGIWFSLSQTVNHDQFSGGFLFSGFHTRKLLGLFLFEFPTFFLATNQKISLLKLLVSGLTQSLM